MHRGLGLAATLGLVALVAGCAAGSSAPTPAAGFGPLGGPGCSPASPISEQSGYPEVQGTPNAGSDGVSLFGWIMANDVPPLLAGHDVKVVWRLVGVGGESVRLFGPTGHEAPLSWGPEAHTSSNYERPGLEWGTGFVLDEPGCWELRFGSGGAGASVWFEVSR
ncbi:MAG: hypothetical protein ABL886_02710 [Rhodoglobus sp.]